MSSWLVCTVLIFAFVKLCRSHCPHIITREDWGALIPEEVFYTPIPLEYVLIHHTATDSCNTASECEEAVLSTQNYHISEDFGDIGYNFLIGGDGKIYEGRGWHVRGAFTIGYNSRSMGLAFIGNYNKKTPTEEQLEAAQQLLACGVEIGELTPNYKLYGARQVSSTESPGNRLYNKIQYWEHFSRKVAN